MTTVAAAPRQASSRSALSGPPGAAWYVGLTLAFLLIVGLGPILWMLAARRRFDRDDIAAFLKLLLYVSLISCVFVPWGLVTAQAGPASLKSPMSAHGAAARSTR